MPRFQPFPAAAGNAKSLHGVLDGRHNGRNRHDDTVDHDIFDSLGVERVLSGETQKTHCSVAQILGQDTIDKHVRHNGRFDKHDTHFGFAPAGADTPTYLPADGEAGAFRAARTSIWNYLFSLSYAYSWQIVNGCNSQLNGTRAAFMSNDLIATRRESLPQIADQSAGDNVGQNEPIDDSMLFAMRHPANEPHDSVDMIDVDSGREGIEDDYRLQQWRLVFLSHSSILLPLELPLTSQRDRLGAAPPPAPSHQFTMVSA